MKTASRIGLVVWVAFASFAPRTADPAGLTRPPLIQKIAMEARVDTDAREIVATARIQVPGGMIRDGAVCLDLGGPAASSDRQEQRWALRVSSLILGGARYEADQVPADSVGIRIPVPGRHHADDPLELVVTYSVSLADGYRDVLGYDAFFANSRSTMWYPQLCRLDEEVPTRGDFQVELDVPADEKVLTSGRLLDSRRDGQRMVYRYQARHISGFAINFDRDHQLIRLERDGLTVEALAPSTQRDAFAMAAGLTLDAMIWYRDLYGFFPSPKIGIAPGHPTYGGGFPAANLYYLHRGNLDPEFLLEITAHELGHYYWGHLVRSAAADELDWVMLGLGIWADQLYLAQVGGRTLDEQWRQWEWLPTYLGVVAEGLEQRLGLSPEVEDDLPFDYNTRVRHAKGALGIYLQARRLGVDRFAALQRGLLDEFADAPLSWTDLALRLEAAGATGARAFFSAWVQGDTHPGRFPAEFAGLLPVRRGDTPQSTQPGQTADSSGTP